MKNLKSKLSMVVIVAIFLSGTVSNVSAGAPVASAARTTELDTMWSTGYWNQASWGGDAMLPWANNPGFGASYFTDSLFGWNSLKKEFIPGLAESMTVDAAGLVYTIKIWDNASWAGPGLTAVGAVATKNLTADDVVFTFDYLTNTRWGDFFERIDSIVATDSKTVTLTLKTAYADSKALRDWLSSSIPIINKAVWLDIAETLDLNITAKYDPDSTATVGDAFVLPDANTMRNRWDSDNTTGKESTFATLPRWQVSSGPYMQTGDPADIPDSGTHERYKYNKDWWGAGLLYRDVMGPATAKASGSADKADNIQPMYVGIKFYPGNDASISAFKAGNIDQGSVGIPKFKDIQDQEAEGEDYLHLWYSDDDVRSYTGQGSNIELVFNTLKYPMSEHWFREAISKAINYAPIASVASANNWLRGSPTYLNTQYNPEHLEVFDEDIHEDYKFEYDASAARKLFTDAGAYEKNVYAKNKWYIDAPTQAAADASLASDYNYTEVEDADDEKEGTQIEIGPFVIPTPMGWTDTTIAVDYWATSISDSLDIQIEKQEVAYGLWESSLSAATFDMCMWTSGPSTSNSPYRVFNSFVQNHASWGNVSSWRGENAEKFEAALAEYEVATTLADEKVAASKMQLAWAQDLVSVPTHINCFWYQYSTAVWKGWVNDGWQYNQPMTAFVTDQIVVKQRLALALAPADSTWNPPANFTVWTEWPEGMEPWTVPGGIPWSGLPIAMAIGVLGTALLVLKKRRI